MIIGHDRQFHVIGSKNLPGYDPFLTDDFTKPFLVDEQIAFQYPPDHSLSGTYYQFDASSGVTQTPFTFVVEQERTVLNEEASELSIRADFILPYQSSVNLRMNSGVKSPFPLSDTGSTGGSGYDAFFIKGSIICGMLGGAKRYYAGPFKGYTKESECVCDGATAVNSLDGSDCRGWLKGSLYENGFSPSYSNRFKYVGEPRENVDHRNPFNDNFLTGTQFNSLDYTWCNIPYRGKRPIPYNLLNDGKGNYAVLIGKKHALVNANTDIDTDNLRFYSELHGLTTAQVVETIDNFQELWDSVGFIPLGNNQTSLDSFHGMSAHFQGLKMIRFANDLPSDISPISLYDPEGSDMIYYALAMGQDGRGHVGVFCPPLDGGNTSGVAVLSFTKNNQCGSFPYPLVVGGDCCGCKRDRTIRSLLLDGMTEDLSVGAILSGDRGGPVITYYSDRPVFLGFVNSEGYNSNAYANLVGVGLGSSKKYEFHWGASFGLIDLLGLYMALTGNDILNPPIKTIRSIEEKKYPFPIGF